MLYPPKNEIHLEDQWFVGVGKLNDLPIVIRGRKSALRIAGHPDFPTRLTIAYEYEKNAVGFPEEEDSEKMATFERRLFAAFEEENHAIAVAIVTHNGLREWLFYTSDPKGSEVRLNATFGSEEPHPIRMEASVDPAWEEFLDIVDSCQT